MRGLFSHFFSYFLRVRFFLAGARASLLFFSQWALASDAVYVWQRSDSAAVLRGIDALLRETPPFEVRLLAGEKRATLRDARSPSVQALHRAHRPFMMVWRIEKLAPASFVHSALGTAALGTAAPGAALSASTPQDTSAAPALIRSIVAQSDALLTLGAPLLGVEIDYDCPSRQLADYRTFLHTLRAALQPLQSAHHRALRLEITALPTWLTQLQLFGALAAEVDAVTLQVHAVAAPELFNRARALQAVMQMPKGTAFHIALPTYGTTLKSAQGPRVIAAEPAVIAEFLTQLSAMKARGELSARDFLGVSWFRMPVIGDDAAWSLATLQAVVAQRPLTTEPLHIHITAATSGAAWVEIENRASIDAAIPPICPEGATPASADGVNTFYWKSPCFYPGRAQFMRPGERLRVGWIR